MVLHTRPAAIITTGLTLQVGSLLVIENPSETIRHTRGNVGDSFERTVSLHRIDNVLTWGGSQCLLVGILDSRKGTVLFHSVAGNAGCIVGTFVVVTTNARLIEPVDDVGTLEVLFPKMWSSVCNLFIVTQLVERSVGLVAWVTCFQ